MPNEYSLFNAFLLLPLDYALVGKGCICMIIRFGDYLDIFGFLEEIGQPI